MSQTSSATTSTIALVVNGEARTFEGDPQTPLLWVLRDTLKLTGTKYSCGIGLCGACSHQRQRSDRQRLGDVLARPQRNA